jgi:Raf kinase inhibitor-like YbhB/YbcL family protein
MSQAMRSLILAPAALILSLAAAPASAAMTLTSRDLTPGGPIAAKHIYPRCGGQNISPDLAWSGAPAGAKSVALTVIDQDVKPHLWSHWIVVGLPTGGGGLAEGAKALPAGARGVKSNFGDTGYAGPCPPPGSGVHHYRFTVWAMPAPTISLSADEKADGLQARLAKTALDRADLTASVAAKP